MKEVSQLIFKLVHFIFMFTIELHQWDILYYLISKQGHAGHEISATGHCLAESMLDRHKCC